MLLRTKELLQVVNFKNLANDVINNYVILAFKIFRDTGGTGVKNSGLSRQIRDSWQLCNIM